MEIMQPSSVYSPVDDLKRRSPRMISMVEPISQSLEQAFFSNATEIVRNSPVDKVACTEADL